MVISVGSIGANVILGINTFTANADKVIEKAFKVQGAINGIAQRASAAGRTFTIMAVGGTLAAKQIGGAFIGAASQMEDYQVVMTSLTKSTEETTRFIKDLTHYAAATPFELNEIIGSASVLTATFKGNTDEIRRWLPALAELGAMAKLQGVSFRESALQFNRMITQGAGAADLFRDRGILAMLGIDAKVDTDIVKLREKLFTVLTDVQGPFAGMAEKLAKTFSGILSQIADQWFIFRNEVMNDSGLFEDLKNSVQKFLTVLVENRKAIVDYISAHREMVETIIIGTTLFLAFAAAMTALGFVIPPLTVSLGWLTSGVSLLNAAIVTMLMKLGMTSAVAFPVSTTLIGLGVAGGIAAYSLRAVGVDLEALRKLFPLTASAMDGLIGSFSALTMVASNSSLALDTANLAVLKMERSVATLRQKALDSSGIGNFIDTTKSQESLKELNKEIASMEGKVVGGMINATTGMSNEWSQKTKDMAKSADVLFKYLGVSTWEQFKKDASSAIDFVGEKFPALKKMITDTKQVDLEQVDYTKLLGMPDFTKPGVKMAEGVKQGVDKAARELERLQEKGRTVFENLFPAEGAMTDVIDKITALQAIGKDSPEAMNRLQADVAENFKGSSAELLQVEQRLVAMGGAAAMVGDNLSAIKDQAAIDEINLQAQEALAQFSQWQYSIDTFNQKLIDLTATAESMGQSLASEDITVAVRELADSLGVDTLEEVQRLEKALIKLGGPAKVVFTEIRDKVKETKIDEMSNQFMDFTRAVSGLGPKFKTMATVAETSFRIIRAAQAAASLGFSEILSLVIEIINAIGLLGGDTEKSMSDMDKFMDDLASTAEEVADRMTDAIVQFARTGKAEIGDLVDFILQEFLRAGISNLIVNPAVSWVGDALGFAKGGVFDKGNLIKAEKGHVTSGPELFQFRSGQMGVRGEAGTEAVLPLTRRNGILGVQSGQTPAPIVNIHNNALPQESVTVTHSQNDGQHVVDIILDVVRVGMMDGSLQSAMRGIR